MRGFLQTYQRILYRYPISVQTVQTSLLMSFGDIIAQTVVEKKSWQEYNAVRTLQFGSAGFILVGPGCALWFKFLARFFGTKGSAVALKKVVVDQLCFAPAMMFAFLTTLNTIQGRPFHETKIRVCRKYFDIMVANYKVWPAVQIVNFYLTPTYYQLLVVQCVAIFWNTYLAWKTAKPCNPAD